MFPLAHIALVLEFSKIRTFGGFPNSYNAFILPSEAGAGDSFAAAYEQSTKPLRSL